MTLLKSPRANRREGSQTNHEQNDGWQLRRNDMLTQLKQVSKLGSLGGLLKLIPGMRNFFRTNRSCRKEMRNLEVIVNSMTKEERKHQEILKYSRKQRIAQGSGKTMQDINKVLKYEQMKEVMKRMSSIKKSVRCHPADFGGMG